MDESEDLAIEFGIRSVPTVLFFKNGQIVDKFVGVVPKAQIVEKINTNSKRIVQPPCMEVLSPPT